MNNYTMRQILIFFIRSLPVFLAAGAILIILDLTSTVDSVELEPRVPEEDNVSAKSGTDIIDKIEGTLKTGEGRKSDLPGAWPCFRGSNRDGIVSDLNVELFEIWGESGPEIFWSLEVGEGYAGAAILNGMVYIIDYDRENQRDVIRCLSFETGEDIWQYSYPVKIKRNHGMSRTVPAVTDDYVVTIGPKCHVTCLDAVSGSFKWMMNLETQYGTTVPPWYAGQCPVIADGKAIIAPAGDETMLISVDCESGEISWECPNTTGWSMTHSSIMSADFFGRKMYIYCASGGIVGVDSENGEMLWESNKWNIRIANIPSPVILDQNMLFLSGGYNRGSMMMRLNEAGDKFEPDVLYSLEPETFGSDQQTPIYFDGHIYGVRPDGRLLCMDTGGNILWKSSAENKFGLGPYIIVNDVIYVMNDTGVLTMVRARSDEFELLDQSDVLDGHDSWGPMAYAAGRLIIRDLTTIKCIKIGNVKTAR
jgi:outer membrane protein assembly factor BamB